MIPRIAGPKMKRAALIGAVTLITLSFQNCGGGFKSSRTAEEVRQSSVANPAVTISGPVDQFKTKSSVQLNGSCARGLDVYVSGDITAELSVPCEEGHFIADVVLSAGDGAKTVVVKQLNNGMESSVSRTFVRDTVAPAPSLIAPANGQAVKGQVVLQGLCEAGLEFEIREGARVQKEMCSTGSYSLTYALTGADGTVQLSIVQNDEAGNSGSVNLSLIKDTVAPIITITAPAAGATVSGSATVSGTCETGVKVDLAGAGVAAPVQADCVGGAYSTMIVFTNGAGTKAILASQTDAAGNSSNFSRSVTRQAEVGPAIAITQPAANSLFQNSLTLTGTCQSGLTITISGNGAMSPASTACNSGAFSVAITPTAGDGSKNIIVSQTNGNGLTGSASRTFIRDTTAPGLTIASPAANTSYKSTLQLMGACENGLPVQISGGGVAAAGSVTCSNGAYSATVTLSNGDGAKNVQVAQTDGAGNDASSTRSFIRDNVAPAVTILSPAADTAAENGLTITGACEGTFMVTASGSGITSNVSRACASNSYSLSVIFTAGEGTKAVTITQTDAAGNAGAVSRNFRRVLPPPDGPALYAQHCSGCHGSLESSSKRGRTAAQISAAIASQPAMAGLSGLSDAQRQAISAALADGPVVTEQKFTCNDPNTPAPVVARRLNKIEYTNTIRRLLSTQSSSDQSAILAELNPLMDAIPPDALNRFTRVDSNLSQAHVDAYLFVARKMGQMIAATDARAKAFFGSCATTANLTTSCLDTFLAGNARKVFRRPLTADDISMLKSAFSSFASEKNAYLIARMLMSPRFLMHIEDQGTEINANTLEISAYELANRLSYHFQQNMPDDQLLAAAADGSLKTEAGLSSQIARLTSSSLSTQTRATIAEFYSEWLGLGSLPRPETSTGQQFTSFAEGASLTRASMVQEIQDMTAHYTFTVDGKFSDLLTSNVSFAKNADLASIYGVNRWSGDAANLVTFPAGQRTGLFTRAAFLAATTAETDPIARGLKIRREVLCDSLPAPPPEIGNMVRDPEPDPTLSTRIRYERKTADPVCMACHSQINPLGFALESFDSLGRYRTVEKIFDETGKLIGQQPVNATVAPAIYANDPTVSANAAQFNQLLATTGKAQACFVQQYFHFTYRKKPDLAKDGCALEDIRQQLSGSGNLRQMFLNVPKSRAFKLKSIMQ